MPTTHRRVNLSIGLPAGAGLDDAFARLDNALIIRS
jgi:hypothetical protein